MGIQQLVGVSVLLMSGKADFDLKAMHMRVHGTESLAAEPRCCNYSLRLQMATTRWKISQKNTSYESHIASRQ